MRVAAKILGLFLALLAVVVAIPALIPDDEYSAGAEQWLHDANNPEVVPDDANRFNALIGFNVAANEDMVAKGAKLVLEVNAQFSDAARSSTDTPKFNDYWDHAPLTTKGDLSDTASKAFRDDPSLWLLDNHDKYLSLLSRNQVLLERFRKIMTMKQYSYAMKLDINAPSIRYSDFLIVKRLNNLSIIDEFITTDKQIAISKLKESIDFSKLMMKQSVMMLDKMIAAELLKIDLLTYSSLLDQAPADDKSKFHIDNLQSDEISMLNAYKGEYAFMSTSLDIEHSYRFNSDYSESDMLEEFLIKHYLKRKVLENNAHKYTWLPLLELGNYPLALRKTRAENIGERRLTWWQIYKDPIAYVLLAIATPSYSTYIDTIDHADATITLLNLKASIYANKISPNHIEDYISSADAVMSTAYAGSKFSWNKDKRELSFDIPDYKNEKIPRIKLYVKKKDKRS